MGKIENTMLFPIPFQYYHIVNVTLMINLLLLSYAFLSIDSVFSVNLLFLSSLSIAHLLAQNVLFCARAISHDHMHICIY